MGINEVFAWLVQILRYPWLRPRCLWILVALFLMEYVILVSVTKERWPCSVRLCAHGLCPCVCVCVCARVSETERIKGRDSRIESIDHLDHSISPIRTFLMKLIIDRCLVLCFIIQTVQFALKKSDLSATSVGSDTQVRSAERVPTLPLNETEAAASPPPPPPPPPPHLESTLQNVLF